jgi:hypothetical protein
MTKHQLTRWIATLGLALAVSVSLGTTPVQAATPVALAAPTKATPTKATPTQPADDAGRYAQREAAHPEAAAFNGDGSAVYIGGSTLAVVLIVVLLVVLL